jgi:Helix-turn-helix domain
MRGTTTRIGPALRQARESLGKSLEEAGRDTRIRPEYLDALERESFHTLRGDVYVRGFLRSYSAYLGLDPDKVLGAYGHVEAPTTFLEQPSPPTPVRHEGIRVLHRRGNWKLALGVAVVLLVTFWAFGFLTRSPQRSPVAPVPTSIAPSTSDAQAPFVSLSVTAKRPTRVTIVSDGTELFSGMIAAGHTREFTASDLLHVDLKCGRCVELSVNGGNSWTPQEVKRRYQASFTPQDFRETPTASSG